MNQIKKIRLLSEKTDVGLLVSGSAASKNLLFTGDELEALPGSVKQLFSVYDDHEQKESRHIEEGTGIPMSDLLEQAGADEADEVKIRSVDGFESVVSELHSRRYYFPGLMEGDETGREVREPLVSFYKNGKKAKFYPHPTIMFGQQGLEDKNKDFFAKGARYLQAGNRDRAFWVKGDRLACSRYFGVDQIFALNEEGEDAVPLLEITAVEGDSGGCLTPETAAAAAEERYVAPGVRLGPYFWEEELGISPLPETGFFVVSGSGDETPLDPKAENYLFFTGKDLKTVGFFDGEQIVEDFAGVRAGEIRPADRPKEIRVPSEKTEGDFYIRVIQNEKETACYYYNLEELQREYADLLTEEDYLYYNHNMNQGKGGMRRVTGRGFPVTGLLNLLPEIPNPEFIESGALLFQIFTNDAYKEKLAADGNELGVYRFILAYEQDQRTETGMEKGDTSAWADEELCFAPIHGNTPFRIYCGKSSANPAVYKNVEGMKVILL
ncbi:MAG: hypothetical protein LIO80_00230 [Lachnospiraceae bacterium]|nr:hypothetical protein [Lachnospiraceae bacterium]